MKETLIILLISISQFTFSQTSKTKIIPTLNHELDSNNLLYCPTFEISWYNLKQKLFKGEDIKIKPSPDYLKYLNELEVNLNDFNLSQSLIYSGIVSQTIADSLNKIKEKNLSHIETDFSNFIGNLISYACIDLSLKYHSDFDVIHHPLIFDDSKVKSFGIEHYSNKDREISKQISIIDYIDYDNFIVEIKLSDKDFSLYLAKIPKRNNIAETYSHIQTRIKTGNRDTLVFMDILHIPIIDIDTKRFYTELMNKNFKNKCCKNMSLNSVFQSIKLQMDEKGVDFSSEAIEEIFCVPQHIMIFDKPYMILIKESQSDLPIFVGWIANSEYMIQEQQHKHNTQ